MDARRGSLPVPRVRQVGFVTPNAPTSPGLPVRSQSGPPDSTSPPLSDSPASNSLSPVMIPPPRHRSTSPLPVPEPSRLPVRASSAVVGCYDRSDSLLGASPPLLSPQANIRVGDGDGEFSDEMSPGWFRRSSSVKFPSSFPGVGGCAALRSDFTSGAPSENLEVEARKPSKAPEINLAEKSGGPAVEVQDEQTSNSKPLKARTTKAERRALQESQRAAKAAAKAPGNKSAAMSEGASNSRPAKQQPSEKKDAPPATSSIAAPDRKGGDYPSEKERRKEVPPPRMQFDDKSRVEKAKRRAVVNQTEARNRVELFRHLPQYERGSQLPDLESKYFQLDPMHPAVYKGRAFLHAVATYCMSMQGMGCKRLLVMLENVCQVGLQYLAGDISGGNARCIAMLQAFREVIRDYSTPPAKSLSRDLTAKVSSYVSFFIECRPLSMSMGNAIRFLKGRISKLPLTLSESEAKASLCSDIDRFINEKIILADKVIVGHAATKIRDGDVLLTYGSPCVVEMILLHAHHELGKQFRVVVVDSRPKLEGQALLRRLVAKGLNCTYTHINAVSYIMHEVTRVFLGASSVLSNGTVYSRVGTACVAMVADAFRVPVLICCEAYKFHERVQLDSICSNELGDPEVIGKVPGRKDIHYLDNLLNKENLQLLNLMYDATPAEYISMIVTDYGMIPPTSVPVIVREYRREHLWM